MGLKEYDNDSLDESVKLNLDNTPINNCNGENNIILKIEEDQISNGSNKDSNEDSNNDLNSSISNSTVNNSISNSISSINTPRFNNNICYDNINTRIKKEYSNLVNLLDIIYEKRRALNQTKSILELKYKKYKKCHNCWGISTIILSSTLTLVESCKLIFFDNDELILQNGLLANFFILSPIALGTIITCSASIVKFKKYQEQMELLNMVIDKSIAMISKLKTKKDEIALLKNKIIELNIGEDYKDDELKLFKNDVNTLVETFRTDIIKEFSVVYQETERCINHSDYNKYLKTINNIDYKKHILRIDKEQFYKEYKHKLDKEKINKMDEKIINESDSTVTCCILK